MRAPSATVEQPPAVGSQPVAYNGHRSNGAAPRDAGAGFRFWACATGSEGRSRTTAVWGLWLDQALIFAADTESVAAGDPAAFPASVVQLDEDGGVRLVEGSVERVDDPRTLTRFASECEAKYGFEPDPSDPDTPVYLVRPAAAA